MLCGAVVIQGTVVAVTHTHRNGPTARTPRANQIRWKALRCLLYLPVSRLNPIVVRSRNPAMRLVRERIDLVVVSVTYGL